MKDSRSYLTSADPEPPVGTVVRTCDGFHWVRIGEFWIMRHHANSERETWIKIAGNYGPVTVVKGK